jgi:hypothetical protein
VVPLESLAESPAHGTIKIVPDSAPAENAATPPTKITRKVLRWSRQPLIRLQVVAIWAFVALLLLITRNEVAWLWFKVASAAAVAFFLWPFVQGPYLLYTRHKTPLHVNFRVIPGPTDPSPQAFRVAHLRALGFTSAGQLVHETGRNLMLHIEIFLHPQNQDSAQVSEIVGGLRTIHTLGFKSRFEDGFAFETNNSHIPPVFLPDPGYQVFRFPSLRSTADIYHLHRKIKERFLSSHRPTLADSEGEFAAFIERAEVAHQRHAQSGHYKLAPCGEHRIYTLKGAIRHAWLLAWPIKQWRALRLDYRAIKMAKDLGFRINPKLGRFEELHPRIKKS